MNENMPVAYFHRLARKLSGKWERQRPCAADNDECRAILLTFGSRAQALRAKGILLSLRQQLSTVGC